MTNFYKKTKKHEVIVVTVIYLVFFTIGTFSYKDFGISVDEWDLRVLGFVNLKYIMEFFSPYASSQIDQIISVPKISEYYGSTHGPIIALPMAFIEYYLNITDSQKYFLIRHYFNHLIFLISNFYFFLLVKNRFNNWIFGIIGSLFLFLSPRIFAESFYNQKDIIFMSFFIINLYYGILFLKNPSIKNSFLFSLTTALSIDIRIMGIIFPPIIFFFSYLKYLDNKNSKLFSGFIFYLIFSPLLIILFWPYLWSDPINNFINIFKNLSSYDWAAYVFYLGDYYKSLNLPWHYILIWIGVSTPIFYLLLFVYGFTNYTLRLKNRLFRISYGNDLNDVWRTESELQDLIFYVVLIIPIAAVILLNSTLYSGWRHLYFIYPLFLLISLKGLYLIYINFFKRKILHFLALTILFLSQISFVMIKDHPHQNVYFNLFSGNNVENLFELDYWGLSNKQAFELILANDNKDIILIGTAGPISLENSREILSQKKKNRILISDNIEADYIIDNYVNWSGKYQKKRYKIPKNFKIYKEILVSGKRIISIYKRI